MANVLTLPCCSRRCARTGAGNGRSGCAPRRCRRRCRSWCPGTPPGARGPPNVLVGGPPAVGGGWPCGGVDAVVNMTILTRAGGAALIRALEGIAGRGGGHDYARRAGTTGGGRRGPVAAQIPLLIRGDITFVRQDFS